MKTVMIGPYTVPIDHFILHCDVCANRFDQPRYTTESMVGLIRPGTKHPIKAEDFTSMMPERMPEIPGWRPGTPWDRLLHYGHRPFANGAKAAMEAQEKGGPQEISVEDPRTGYKGPACVTEHGIEIPQTRQRTREIQTDEELEEEWNERMKKAGDSTDTPEEPTDKPKRRGRPKGSGKKKNA